MKKNYLLQGYSSEVALFLAGHEYPSSCCVLTTKTRKKTEQIWLVKDLESNGDQTAEGTLGSLSTFKEEMIPLLMYADEE